MHPFTDEDVERRVLSRITESASGCWLWQGATNDCGYGQLRRQGRTIYVHRFMYSRRKGPIPEGAHLAHSCDTPACVNPAHLTAGPPAANLRDMREKGRSRNRYSGSTECPRSHPRTPENTFITRAGFRTCIPCRRVSQAKSVRKRRAAQ